MVNYSWNSENTFTGWFLSDHRQILRGWFFAGPGPGPVRD